MYNLRVRLIEGGDPTAASDSARLLRQLAAIGEDALFAVGRLLAASSRPNAENTLVSLSLFSVTTLGLLGQLERRPCSPAGADSVPRAALLAWTGAVLSATPILLPAAGPVTHGHLAAAAFSAITMHLSMSRHLGADVQADVQAHFPAILHTLPQSAGRLAMPAGQPFFHPGGWLAVVSCAGVIVNAKEYGEAATAALATADPGIKPGRKLAALLLDFLCCLADMGLPSNFVAAPQAAGAAAA
ncbi:hypothetical protein ABPG77_004284 [Micractinium sp. CCAP 211/92]